MIQSNKGSDDMIKKRILIVDDEKELGATIEEIIEYTLPIEMSKRTIIKIKKMKVIEKKYPRDYSKMLKDLQKLTK